MNDLVKALAVTLDYCEETGEVHIELLRRLAELLFSSNVKVAYGWHSSQNLIDQTLYCRYFVNGGLIARISQLYDGSYSATCFLDSEIHSGVTFKSLTDVKHWCDDTLNKNGLILLKKNRTEYNSLNLIKVS